MSKSRAEVRSKFHGEVDVGTDLSAEHVMSAEYVVTHAARQRQRGRNPSVRYRDIRNPHLALAAAQADIESRTAATPGDYTDFAGRVAIIRVWSELQRDIAASYAEARITDNGALGAIIQEVKDGETLQAPLHYRPTDEGTVEVMLPI